MSLTDGSPLIFVAGHQGMVGSAIVRRLLSLGHTRIITRTRDELDIPPGHVARRTESIITRTRAELDAVSPQQTKSSARIITRTRAELDQAAAAKDLVHTETRIITRTRAELDLLDQAAVCAFFQETPIDQVYLAAARVGGILANNTYPAEFIYQNLVIEANIIHAAFKAGVKKLLFLGSSCIYPRHADQPMKEEALLTGVLEPTNEPYAVAKIAGIKLCESYNRQYGCDFRSVMPTNLYGPGDNFHPENSHVIPALIRRFHEARTHGHDAVTVWGTGAPRREFLHVDDLAEACVFVMNLPPSDYQRETQPMLSHINVGAGVDVSIAEVSEMIARTVGFEGRIAFDPAMPDGAPRKLLDVSKLARLGWQSRVPLETGLKQTYAWYTSKDLSNQP